MRNKILVMGICTLILLVFFSSGCFESEEKEEEKESTDRDGDGIPNDWETANGLNPDDASDATLDGDNDGIPCEVLCAGN